MHEFKIGQIYKAPDGDELSIYAMDDQNTIWYRFKSWGANLRLEKTDAMIIGNWIIINGYVLMQSKSRRNLPSWF